MTILDEAEVRVLGALIEKQIATPEYYPLTLNALTAACNQKNNRHPVVSYDEATVELAVESLRQKNLAYVFYGAGSRVPKYKHVAAENLQLKAAELALACVLMLRGPQTLGELRDRSARLYEFPGLEEVEAALGSLATREEPVVTRLARRPGQKEARYAHLLSGEVFEQHEEESSETAAAAASPSHARTTTTTTSAERVLKLEQEVETLRAELDGFRREFETFKKQFE
ncbi:MAG TPA: YceH family protein [Pyrinomonadaceae bacterium]